DDTSAMPTSDIPHTPTTEEPTATPHAGPTKLISKTKKIKKRISKHKESEMSEEVADEITETKESVELESSEIQPTTTEDEPTEMPTPMKSEERRVGKKSKKRISKPNENKKREENTEEITESKETIEL